MSADLKSKFVTEEEVEEKKRVRQEEWEKVRKPHDPIEAPEEVVDHRSLYERLEEQKNKKQEEHDETYALKNQIRGLDEGETDFLAEVNQRQQDYEKRKAGEEQEVIDEIREQMAARDTAATSVTRVIASASGNKLRPATNTQKLLLAGAVKRKSSAASEPTENEKRFKDSEKEAGGDSNSLSSSHLAARGALTPVGVLPGVGAYVASSDETSDSCSEDSDVETDVFKRTMRVHVQQQQS